jgi:NTP pyrophosphatase (non-canonical NTP hydrolase)
MTEGSKFDADKLQYHLVPTIPFEEVVKVLTFGAIKYDEDNWKLVQNGNSRYYSAAMRHLEAWRKGEGWDPETGVSHLAHAVCCLLFIRGIELEECSKWGLNEYQSKAREYAIYKGHDCLWSMYPFLGLFEEAGEVAGKFAKAERGDRNDDWEDAVLKELADVLWMVSECSRQADVDLQYLAELSLKKLSDRKARGVIQGSGDNR